MAVLDTAEAADEDKEAPTLHTLTDRLSCSLQVAVLNTAEAADEDEETPTLNTLTDSITYVVGNPHNYSVTDAPPQQFVEASVPEVDDSVQQLASTVSRSADYAPSPDEVRISHSTSVPSPYPVSRVSCSSAACVSSCLVVHLLLSDVDLLLLILWCHACHLHSKSYLLFLLPCLFLPVLLISVSAFCSPCKKTVSGNHILFFIRSNHNNACASQHSHPPLWAKFSTQKQEQTLTGHNLVFQCDMNKAAGFCAKLVLLGNGNDSPD